jgi:hypothetical protein
LNQARCRVTLKKRMSDCAILGARIVLILDDLLWVLTDDQLKAALHFLGSVSGLVRAATERTQKVFGKFDKCVFGINVYLVFVRQRRRGSWISSSSRARPRRRPG